MSDFFVKDEQEEPKSRKPAVQEREAKANIPANYIPIKLSSLGKLSTPKIVHVRNYNGEDALKLAMTSVSDDPEESMLQVLLEVLQEMIYEDVNTLDLHQKEMEEIMLNVYLNWWSQFMQDLPYPYEEDELKVTEYFSEDRVQRVKNKEEVPRVSIDLKRLSTNNLPSEFKEPIVISKDNFTCKFKLPRIGDAIKANDYVEEKYLEQESKFTVLVNDIQFNIRNKNNPNVEQRHIDKELYAEYLKYRNTRNSDFAKYQQMCSIVEVNGEKVTEDNLFSLYNNIDLKTLGLIQKTVEEYGKFGVDEDNVPMISPITREEVIRRFQFRALDFIPSMDIQDNTGYSISFGT